MILPVGTRYAYYCTESRAASCSCSHILILFID